MAEAEKGGGGCATGVCWRVRGGVRPRFFPESSKLSGERRKMVKPI